MRIKRIHYYILALIVISFISHWYVFFDSGRLSAGDWIYVPDKLVLQLSKYGAWNTHENLGEKMFMSSNIYFYWLNSILLKVFPFFSWQLFTRVFFLIPIVFLTPLVSFFLFKKIFRKNFSAFFASIVYSFNPFFLRLQLDFLTYASIWWILPATFLCIIKFLDGKDSLHLIKLSFLLFLSITIEPRISVLVLFFLSSFLFFYIIIIKDLDFLNKVKTLLFIFIFIFIGILMHSPWLLQVLLSRGTEVVSGLSQSPFGSYYNILDAFTLHPYMWTNNLSLASFIKQPINVRLFLVPLFSLLGLIFYKPANNRKKLNLFFLFFSFILILSIFLGKQQNLPFADIYTWLFYNFPLFKIFRESSKFFILIALPMSFFYSISLVHITSFLRKKNKIPCFIFIILIIFFSTIFNTQHFIDQKIGGMVRGQDVDLDYLIFEEKISEEDSFYRILWQPKRPRFGFYSFDHPSLTGVYLGSIYSDRIPEIIKGRSYLPLGDKYHYIINQSYSDNLLDNLAVRYVVVPNNQLKINYLSLNNVKKSYYLFEHYDERNYFISELNKLKYLKEVDLGTDQLRIYENLDYKPHIYLTNEKESINNKINFEYVNFKCPSPQRCYIKLENISGLVYLNFAENFDPHWDLYVGKYTFLNGNNDNLVDEKYHFKNEMHLNSFIINSTYLKQEFSIVSNKDGSTDLDLTLYFTPQHYFEVGKIISLSSFALLLFFSIIRLIKSKRECFR